VAQKFHFSILRIEVTRASRGLSAIAELLVKHAWGVLGVHGVVANETLTLLVRTGYDIATYLIQFH